MIPQNDAVTKWVSECETLLKPEKVHWCDGSEQERLRLLADALDRKEFYELDQTQFPNCYFHHSHTNDVARVESRTFICTRDETDAGPLNNWKAPAEMYGELTKLFDGIMSGRTMYVVPYVMGPVGSAFSKVGVQITDSIYVVLSMRIMARMGDQAWRHLASQADATQFTRCLHSVGELNPDNRYIAHFPEDNTVWSINSGYGGNALLGKKCLALRIASWLGRQEGWLAEHMLILGIEYPDGQTKYVAAAFPSACGKTNLAMLIPPERFREQGYKVWTVGDDIAWLRIGDDGRLWAVNPEAGFFGVVPGTNSKTNKNALDSMMKNALYTNVVRTKDGGVWWEGADWPKPKPGDAFNWKNEEWNGEGVGAHPNSRFTAPASNAPCMSSEWENPSGVPISAILFGGRRARLAPLIYEARDFNHGVFIGSSVASEQTAAAEGAVGAVRYDPMAMRPFIGYNVGDYLAHWIAMGDKIPKPPKIFHVNWFRRDDEGQFIWPGFGENMRPLLWALDRCEGNGEAIDTPIGWVPEPHTGIDTEGIHLHGHAMDELTRVEKAEWAEEAARIEAFYATLGDRVPAALRAQLDGLKARTAL